ncbi:MAG: 1-acyl-sn-glycerol-3-phosphate acyltransferase [Alphaproteobacteria bacterium]|nr:1-acyl-sn-glycerol-3-phosphate acyltransferase [Alphaproteobacteria bacterium]
MTTQDQEVTAEEKDFSATYLPLPKTLEDLPIITNPEWPDTEHLTPEEAAQMTPKEITNSRLQYLDTVDEMQDPGPKFFKDKKTRKNFFDILRYIDYRHDLIKRINQLPLREAREEAAQITLNGLAAAGMKINVYGKNAHDLGHKHSLAVSNHFGWIDGVLLFALTKMATAGKRSSFTAAKVIGVLGRLMFYKGLGDVVKASNLGFVPVQRGAAEGKGKGKDKLAGHKQMEANARTALWGDNQGANAGLAIFSERTTTDGHKVGISPSSTAIRALFDEEDPTKLIEGGVIQPIAMTVRRVEGQDVKVGERDIKRDKIAWYGANVRTTFTHFAGNTMGARDNGGVELNIYLLPPIDPAKLKEQGVEVTPRTLANIAFAQIDQVLKTEPDEIMKHEIAAKKEDRDRVQRFTRALEGPKQAATPS